MKQIGNYLIAIRLDGTVHKICRVFFGRDGTYYVTSPYHKVKEAFFIKATVNYHTKEQLISSDQAIDSAKFDDENGRVKLSHHPDGFLQFSGQGILSGKTPEGQIKGIGVDSWPLDSPVPGPAFAVTAINIASFETLLKPQRDVVEFSSTDVPDFTNEHSLIVEGHYFPAEMRRFIEFSSSGNPFLRIVHPSGAIMTLRVLLPDYACERQGFLGLDVFCAPRNAGPASGFFLSGSTGNIRYNEAQERLGDAIFCLYPRDFLASRSLNWPPPQSDSSKLA